MLARTIKKMTVFYLEMINDDFDCAKGGFPPVHVRFKAGLAYLLVALVLSPTGLSTGPAMPQGHVFVFYCILLGRNDPLQ